MSTLRQKWNALTLGIFGRDPRHLWRRYAVAVLFVALSLFFSNLAPKATLNTVQANAEIINTAGRQRMLSQRILYLSELIATDITIDEETHSKLRSSISEFETAQKRLSSVRKARLKANPDKQQSLLNQAVDDNVAVLVASATAFEAADLKSKAAVKPSNDLNVWPDKILNQLDAAVRRDEKYVVEKVQYVNFIADACLILALLILLMEAIFIFLPGHRLIVKFLKDQEDYETKITSQNEELQHFTYVASHDLRSPLRGIENLTRFVEQDMAREDYAEIPTHMTLLRSRISRMNRLLSDMLAFSKIGKGSAEVTTFDLGDALEEVVDWIDIPDGFSIKLPPDLPTLTAPISAVQQIFLNLLNNAVKHHDKQAGLAEVKYHNAGDAHVFVVADDGPGIPAEYREYIFQAFNRLNPRDAVEGSGIGLAITQKFVASVGGKIRVLDTDAPRGTSFEVTLPK